MEIEPNICCINHPNKYSKRFCNRCSENLCNSCALDFHSDHISELCSFNIEVILKKNNFLATFVKDVEVKILTKQRCMYTIFHKATHYCKYCLHSICKECIPLHTLKFKDHEIVEYAEHIKILKFKAKVLNRILRFQNKDFILSDSKFFNITKTVFSNIQMFQNQLIIPIFNMKENLENSFKLIKNFQENLFQRVFEYYRKNQKRLLYDQKKLTEFTKELEALENEKDFSQFSSSLLQFESLINELIGEEELKQYTLINKEQERIDELCKVCLETLEKLLSSFSNKINSEILEFNAKVFGVNNKIKDFLKYQLKLTPLEIEDFTKQCKRETNYFNQQELNIKNKILAEEVGKKYENMYNYNPITFINQINQTNQNHQTHFNPMNNYNQGGNQVNSIIGNNMNSQVVNNNNAIHPHIHGYNSFNNSQHISNAYNNINNTNYNQLNINQNNAYINNNNSINNNINNNNISMNNINNSGYNNLLRLDPRFNRIEKEIALSENVFTVASKKTSVRSQYTHQGHDSYFNYDNNPHHYNEKLSRKHFGGKEMMKFIVEENEHLIEKEEVNLSEYAGNENNNINNNSTNNFYLDTHNINTNVRFNSSNSNNLMFRNNKKKNYTNSSYSNTNINSNNNNSKYSKYNNNSNNSINNNKYKNSRKNPINNSTKEEEQEIKDKGDMISESQEITELNEQEKEMEIEINEEEKSSLNDKETKNILQDEKFNESFRDCQSASELYLPSRKLLFYDNVNNLGSNSNVVINTSYSNKYSKKSKKQGNNSVHNYKIYPYTSSNSNYSKSKNIFYCKHSRIKKLSSNNNDYKRNKNKEDSVIANKTSTKANINNDSQTHSEQFINSMVEFNTNSNSKINALNTYNNSEYQLKSKLSFDTADINRNKMRYESGEIILTNVSSNLNLPNIAIDSVDDENKDRKNSSSKDNNDIEKNMDMEKNDNFSLIITKENQLNKMHNINSSFTNNSYNTGILDGNNTNNTDTNGRQKNYLLNLNHNSSANSQYNLINQDNTNNNYHIVKDRSAIYYPSTSRNSFLEIKESNNVISGSRSLLSNRLRKENDLNEILQNNSAYYQAYNKNKTSNSVNNNNYNNVNSSMNNNFNNENGTVLSPNNILISLSKNNHNNNNNKNICTNNTLQNTNIAISNNSINNNLNYYTNANAYNNTNLNTNVNANYYNNFSDNLNLSQSNYRNRQPSDLNLNLSYSNLNINPHNNKNQSSNTLPNNNNSNINNLNYIQNEHSTNHTLNAINTLPLNPNKISYSTYNKSLYSNSKKNYRNTTKSNYSQGSNKFTLKNRLGRDYFRRKASDKISNKSNIASSADKSKNKYENKVISPTMQINQGFVDNNEYNNNENNDNYYIDLNYNKAVYEYMNKRNLNHNSINDLNNINNTDYEVYNQTTLNNNDKKTYNSNFNNTSIINTNQTLENLNNNLNNDLNNININTNVNSNIINSRVYLNQNKNSYCINNSTRNHNQANNYLSVLQKNNTNNTNVTNITNTTDKSDFPIDSYNINNDVISNKKESNRKYTNNNNKEYLELRSKKKTYTERSTITNKSLFSNTDSHITEIFNNNNNIPIYNSNSNSNINFLISQNSKEGVIKVFDKKSKTDLSNINSITNMISNTHYANNNSNSYTNEKKLFSFNTNEKNDNTGNINMISHSNISRNNTSNINYTNNINVCELNKIIPKSKKINFNLELNSNINYTISSNSKDKVSNSKSYLDLTFIPKNHSSHRHEKTKISNNNNKRKKHQKNNDSNNNINITSRDSYMMIDESIDQETESLENELQINTINEINEMTGFKRNNNLSPMNPGLLDFSESENNNNIQNTINSRIKNYNNYKITGYLLERIKKVIGICTKSGSSKDNDNNEALLIKLYYLLRDYEFTSFELGLIESYYIVNSFSSINKLQCICVSQILNIHFTVDFNIKSSFILSKTEDMKHKGNSSLGDDRTNSINDFLSKSFIFTQHNNLVFLGFNDTSNIVCLERNNNWMFNGKQDSQVNEINEKGGITEKMFSCHKLPDLNACRSNYSLTAFSIPNNEVSPNNNYSLVAVSGDDKGSCEIYCSSNKTWILLPNLNHDRRKSNSIIIQSTEETYILVFFGINYKNEFVSSIEKLNLSCYNSNETNSTKNTKTYWELLSITINNEADQLIISSLKLHSMSLLNNYNDNNNKEILIIGGITSNNIPNFEIMRFNTETNDINLRSYLDKDEKLDVTFTNNLVYQKSNIDTNIGICLGNYSTNRDLSGLNNRYFKIIYYDLINNCLMTEEELEKFNSSIK